MATITDKASGSVTAVPLGDMVLSAPSIVQLDIRREAVANFERDGLDLIIHLQTGETIRIVNFFASENGNESDLVLEDDGTLWWGQHSPGAADFHFTQIQSVDQLIASGLGGFGGMLLAGLGALAMGGIAAAAGGGDSGGSPDDDDTQAPDTPTEVSVSDDGRTVTGRGEPGSTATVYGPDGTTAIGTGTVGEDGSFTVILDDPQTNGEDLTVTLTDGAGNESSPTGAMAPDLTAPDAPTAALENDTGASGTDGVTSDGTVIVSGLEPGATWEYSIDGGETWISGSGGSFELPAGSFEAGDVQVRQIDTAGNASTSISFGPVTVDTVAPEVMINPTDGTVLAGTAEPGSTVEIDTDGDGTPDLTTTADETGNWSVAPDAPLADDTVVTVTASDAAGNVGTPATATVDADLDDTTPPASPVIASAMDNLAPVTGSLGSGDSTNDTTPTLVGTAEAGSTVTIYQDGAEIGTATADETGNWSFTPGTALTDSDYSFTAIATDAAGNPSSESAVFDLTVDTATPVVAANDLVTNDSTPELTGTIDDPEATVIVNVNGTDYAATNNGDGSWSLILPDLADGEYAVSVVATDEAGNAATGAGSLTVDTVAPEVTINPTDGTVLAGTAEPGSTVEIDTDGDGTPDLTTTADETGNWSVAPAAPLADDTVVTVTATDAAGNVGTPVTATVDADLDDTTPPAAPVIASATDDAAPVTDSLASGDSTNDTTPTLVGTAEAGSTVTISQDGSEIGTATADQTGNWSFTPGTALADGDYSFTAIATDAAGNPSSESAAFDLTVDATAPDAPTVAVGPNADGTITVIGQAEPGSTVTVTFPDGSTQEVVAEEDGSYEATSATPQTTGGVTAIATDAAGNASDPGTAAYTDETAPTAPTAEFDDTGSEISGTAEPGSTVGVDLDGDGTPEYTATANPDGTYTVTVEPALTNGEEVTVTATDAAGNESAPTAATAPDTTAPDAPTLEVAPNEDGTITASGQAEPDSTVTVTFPDGSTAEVTAGPDGSYEATSATPQTSGDVTAVATDATGSSSDTTVAYVDITAPTAPTAEFNGTGSEISGTAEPGSAVTIYDQNGDVLGTGTADPDGTYTVTVDPALTNGEDVTVTATDAAGNESDPTPAEAPDSTTPDAPAITAAVDDAGSATGDVSSGGNTDDNNPTLVGTAEPGSTVTISYGTETATVTADEAGDWSFTPGTPLADGDYSFTATATDAGGNISGPSAAFDLTIDTTAPDVPAITSATDDFAPATGSLGSGDSTNDATPTLVGTAEANSTVTIYQDGTEIGTATADGTGDWSFTPETELADGDYSFTVTSTDELGNVSAESPAFGLTVDTVAPTVLINPTDGTVLTGTAEPGSTVEIDTNGDGTPDLTTTVDAAGNWSVTPDAPLADNTVVTASATDPAGNVGAPATATVDTDLNDMTPPAAPVIASATDDQGTVTGNLASGDSTDDTLPVLSGTAEAGSTVTLSQNGMVIGTATADGSGNWTFPLETELAEGTYSFTATATDAAGNPSLESAAFDLTVDLTAPTAPIAVLETDSGTAGDGVTTDGTVVVSGLETDATWEYSTDGGTTWVAGSGTSFDLPAGVYDADDVQVRQTDAAGNLGPAGALGPVTVAALVAVDDTATLDMGSQTAVTHPSETTTNVGVIGVAEAYDGTDNGTEFTVADGNSGDVVIEVSQTALAAVADAFRLDVYDASGNLVYSAVTENSLVGDVAGLDVLGVTGDDSLVATVTGLQPGTYTVVVANDQSTLGGLLDTDGGGISLQELGDAGVVLGPNNQDVVLDTVRNALGSPGLGDVAAGLLDPLLDGLNGSPVSDLVGAISDVLSNPLINLSGLLDSVVDAVADALLSNTLTLLQSTTITTTLTEYDFANETVTGDNLITDAIGDGGADDVVDGTVVSSVTNSEGTSVTVPDGGSTTIAGLYGELEIFSDGSYTYNAYGMPESIGQSEVFTYTISDGSSTATANLTIDIDGNIVEAVDDVATAGVTFENVVETVPDTQLFAFNAAISGLGDLTAEGTGSGTFTVATGDVSDVTVTVEMANLLSVLPSYTITLLDADGNTVGGPITETAALSVFGTGVQVTFEDLAAGTYTLQVSTINVSLTGYTSNVSIAQEVTHLTEFDVSGVTPTSGNLLGNDVTNGGQADVQVLGDDGTYVDVATGSPVTLTGDYGTLTVSADGSFTYTPSDTVAHFTTPVNDVFEYQLVDPSGELEGGTLTVTVDPTDAGVATALSAPSLMMAEDATLDDEASASDIVPLMTFGVVDDGAFESPPLDSSSSDLLSDAGSTEISLDNVPTTSATTESVASPVSTADTASTQTGVAESPPMDDPLAYLTTTPDETQQNDLPVV